MKMSRTPRITARKRVWVVRDSCGYWKVVDYDGNALMTALDSKDTARRWATNTINRERLTLQETPWIRHTN